MEAKGWVYVVGKGGCGCGTMRGIDFLLEVRSCFVQPKSQNFLRGAPPRTPAEQLDYPPLNARAIGPCGPSSPQAALGLVSESFERMKPIDGLAYI